MWTLKSNQTTHIIKQEIKHKPNNPIRHYSYFPSCDFYDEAYEHGTREDMQKTKTPISFLFFGDLMLDRHIKEEIEKHSLDYLLEDLVGEEKRFFQGYDIISANLEGAVTKKGAHYPPQMAYDFAFNPAYIQILQKYNFNFFNLANNHLSDQGIKGEEETRQILDDLKIDYSGCRDRQIGDCSWKIIDVNGQKVAMLGFSMVYGNFSKEEASSLIKKTRQMADWVIVNIHWGQEYRHEQNQTQIKMAHYLIDQGADLIIGHHPHVVEGIEVYKDKVIFYSLGNFIFDQYFSPDTQESLAVGVVLDKNSSFVYLFPLESHLGKVKFKTGESKIKFLESLTSWSSENLRDDILRGVIKFDIQ